MTIKEALTIVVDLAVENAFDDEVEAEKSEELWDEMIRQQEAIKAVYDLKEGMRDERV